MNAFDFDAWAELARRDPQAFQKEREKTLRKAVEQAPAHLRPRLNRLVDDLCGAPPEAGLAAAATSHSLLMGSLGQLRGAWAQLLLATGKTDVELPKAVLEFTEMRLVAPPPEP